MAVMSLSDNILPVLSMPELFDNFASEENSLPNMFKTITINKSSKKTIIKEKPMTLKAFIHSIANSSIYQYL